jgi:ATP-binding cassette subfamily B protein
MSAQHDMKGKGNQPAGGMRPAFGGPGGGRGPGGGPMAMMPGEKAKDFRKTFRTLIGYLNNHLAGIVLVFLFAILSTLFSIISPMILGKATTLVFEGSVAMAHGTGSIDFPAIARIALLLVSLYVASALFMLIQGFVMTGIAMKVSFRMRSDIEAKLHRLPLGYFDSRPNGEVLSHITNDVDTVTQSLNQSITQIITSVTTMVGILAMMLVINVRMTLVSLVMMPLSFVLIRLIVSKSQPHFKAQQAGIGTINGQIEETFGSHLVMKAFNGEVAAMAEFETVNGKLYRSVWKSQFLSGLMQPIMGFLANVGYVAVCILGGYFAITGQLAVGNIQAFIQYVRQFNQPITQVANISNVLQGMAAAAERVFKFLGEAEEPADPPSPAHIGGTVASGKVEFSHVRFGYTDAKTVIKDFSASIEPGKKVAIVGPTGAGKTTIVKLLMRFYDIQGGSILVDGVDIARATRDEVRSVFGMVLQETWLYSASIRDNIRYGRPDASDDEVVAAAKAAQVDHFVRTLPGGYDFLLNEESSNISRGQKQLLTIARVILANPRVLILDEATSSVDTLTEVLIQKAMDNLMRGRTSFVIAHRLSTIRNADLILVLNEGDIVEQGTHNSLLETGGFYASLYQSQFDTEDD